MKLKKNKEGRKERKEGRKEKAERIEGRKKRPSGVWWFLLYLCKLYGYLLFSTKRALYLSFKFLTKAIHVDDLTLREYQRAYK